MSEELFELEATYDRHDLAAVFEEIASALAGGRPMELVSDDRRLSIDVPPRVEAEFEIERETESEDDDRDGDSPVAEIELEIELEWEESGERSSVRIEPRDSDEATASADDEATTNTAADNATTSADADDATVSADAEHDEGKSGTPRPALLTPAAASERVSDGDAATDETAGSSERRSRFEIYRDRADQWRWRLVHWNGNIVADGGEGYASRSNAERAVRSVMEGAPAARIEHLENGD